MNITDVATLVKQLPTLIAYLVPGYFLLATMNFVLSSGTKEDEHLGIKSLAISYVLIIACNSACRNWDLLSGVNPKVLAILIAPITGYLLARILLSENISCIFRGIAITRSVRNSFLSDIVDFERGLLALVYLPEERKVYKGHIRKFDDDGESDNTFILLSNYVKYDYDGEEKDNHENENNYRVLINTKDISRIELVYDITSKKIE
ncbi:hypothetical protein [Syntrophomonas wolfei]|jgi:hypothetical protein|uniref:hypothetical protein n=1 Tax=Syntrophomonas wolfei TaxID=863 RepID=UPI0007734E2B|nr:hypothetical protein [Syntrophomonas wolfei]